MKIVVIMSVHDLPAKKEKKSRASMYKYNFHNALDVVEYVDHGESLIELYH